jgi:hypothetical protein
MSLYGYLPHEYNYALFLADHYDYYPWDSMIRNMVSERYPRDEDDDASASASGSDIDEDEDSDDVTSASAIQDTSASHDCIRFGSFESPITPVSNPVIKPEFDRFSIKIGETSCVLVPSFSNIIEDEDSVFVVEKDEKLQFVEPELKTHESVYGFFEASEDFVIHTASVRLRSSVYGVTAVRRSALWLFVRKQTEMIASAVDNKIHFFQLHDESIVDFNPGGSVGSCSFFSVFIVLRQIRFRLWWIPWDRGKKGLSSFKSIHAITEARVFICFCLVRFNTPLKKLSRGRIIKKIISFDSYHKFAFSESRFEESVFFFG